MKRFTAIVATVSIAGVCCVVAVAVSTYYYHLYRKARTQLEERLDGLESRVGRSDRWHEIQDVVPSCVYGRMASDCEGNVTNQFTLEHGKDGTVISSPLCLPAGCAEKQEFRIRTDKAYGRYPVDGWILRTEPPDALGRFEEFRIYCTRRPRELRIVAKPKTNAAIDMSFTLVLLRGLE